MGTLRVPVPGVKGEFVEFDSDQIPQRLYEAALIKGLQGFLGRGMTKVDKKDKAAVLAQVEKNRKDVLADKTRVVGSAGSKISGALKTEAMRIARNVVKDTIKREGYKISSYEAAEITAAAKQLLETDPSIMVEAQENLDKRDKGTHKIELGKVLDLSKAEKSKALKKGDKPPLSAKQAGMIAARAKPTPAVQPGARH